MRPRHGAAAGGARARPAERRRAEGAAGGRRSRAGAAPAAPGDSLRQDLRRLRPALRLLRHPADQGRLRDRAGRRGAARRARRAGRRRARARARRPGHVALGAAGLGRAEPPARASWRRSSPPRPGCACSTCSRTASTTGFSRPLRRTRCRTWTSPCSTPPAPSCAAWGAPATATPTSPCSSASARVLPGVAVRSTFIAGFPGETDADFEELLAFVRAARLAVAGVFVFDAQEGTPAAAHAGRPCRASSPSSAPPASARPSTARPSASGRPRAAARWTSSSSAARRAPDGRRRRAESPCRRPTSTGAPTLTRRPGAGAASSCAPWCVDSLGYDVEAVAATGGT